MAGKDRRFGGVFPHGTRLLCRHDEQSVRCGGARAAPLSGIYDKPFIAGDIG